LQMEYVNQLPGEISEYIINNYEEKIIRKLIVSNYGHFLPYEQEEIVKLTKENRPECRDMIEEKIKAYLHENDTVILDGFVNFRLKDYKNILLESINTSVEQFNIKREYETFISLLKHFIETQIPLYNTVNLVGHEDGGVSVMTETGEYITEDCMGDNILDALLTIAPRQVKLHNIHYMKNEELLITIKSVFEGKFIICKGCLICGRIQ